ncbi:MAG: PrsW family glutamic-type intramembrane protease, partial [Nannocystaceae bacterium]
MEPFEIFALSFAPGLLWLAWVFSRTRFRRGPTRLVFRTFLLGALIVAPVIIVEAVLKHYVVGDGVPTSVEDVAFVSFVVAGLVEEVAKFLVVRASIFRSPYFDEP